MLHQRPTEHKPEAATDEINAARTYLPLLNYPDELVQRQASLILLAHHGTQAFTLLRRLLSDADVGVRQAAERALVAFGRHSGQVVAFQPFRGMHIECLGRWRVFIDHREILPEHWAQRDGGRAGGRKVQQMLAYLVHCGHHGATPGQLSAAVWGDTAPNRALGRTLTALRQTLKQFGGEPFAEQVLNSTYGHYTLDPGGYSSDVQLFERTMQVAERIESSISLAEAVPHYRRACGLYGGRYLAAVGLADDLIDERRAEVLNAYLSAMERQAEHAYLSGDDAQCLALCHQSRRADPSDESLTLWMLRAYARQHRTDEIERLYWRYLRTNGLHQNADPDDRVVQWFRELKT